MSTEQALLADIQANPDDEAPRLVYTDWLQEHGQTERAEFMRVQTALGDAPEDREAYLELRARESALLEEHGKEWFGPLKKLGVLSWTLRHGLVAGVTMHGRSFLNHGEELFRLAPVHAVALRGSTPILRELEECPLLERLWGLDLSAIRWFGKGDVPRVLSPRLAGLRWLDLSNGPLESAGVRALADLPHLSGLRRLVLRNVWLGEEGARVLAGHIDYPRVYAKKVNLSGLVALDVRDNTIYAEGFCELVHSPHLAGLRELALTASTAKSSEELDESRYLRKLTTLRISGDFSEGIGLLLCCQFIKRLRVLDLGQTRATDEHAQEIATDGRLRELRHLGLGGNFIDDGLRALGASTRLPRLRRLDLSGNCITDAGVEALCASTPAKGLRELDLSDNRITDPGALALAGSPLLRQLEGLNLEGNLIGRKTVLALHRAAAEACLPRHEGDGSGLVLGWWRPERLEGVE
jgi:uncharacterized protein (TIGR02996 family)